MASDVQDFHGPQGVIHSLAALVPLFEYWYNKQYYAGRTQVKMMIGDAWRNMLLLVRLSFMCWFFALVRGGMHSCRTVGGKNPATLSP